MKKTCFFAWLCLFVSALMLARADIVYSLRLSTSNITLSVGESRQITWSVEPVNLVEHTVLWESDNPYVASVDQRGKITARAAGATTVRATMETGVTRRVNVTVSGNPVTELSVSEQVLQLEVGESADLFYTVNANADDKRVRWTSDDTSVATVNQEGHVTATGGGVATVTVMCVNGMTATTVIYVPSDVQRVNVTSEQSELGVGQTLTLTAEALPINARNRSLHWESSDPAVAEVDQNGMVTGIAAGECKIGARCENGVFGYVTLAVRLYPAEIRLEPETLILSRENHIGEVTLKAEPEDAEMGEVIWSSSDEGVARVENGVVTARGYGSAVITVETKNGLKAEAQVNVGEVPKSVRFNSSLYMLPLGGEGVETFVVFSPYESVSAGYTISVEDEKIATIDESGFLHGRALGTTAVTLTTVEGLSCTAEVRVYENIKNLYVSESKLTLNQYEFKSLYFYSETGRAFTGQLSARCSDESVCVYTDGGLYARAPGFTEITFSNPGTSAVCTVTVTVLPGEDYSTRLIALTFDNGPDKYTKEILDVLDKYNVRATFFLLGRNIELYPELAALYKDTPHELGNHTYENASIASKNVATSAGALEKTDRLAKKNIGRELTLLRAPDALLPEGLLSSFFDTRRFVGRGIVIGDTGESDDPEEIAREAQEKVYSTCILTFHDSGACTAEALDILLPSLLRQGYRFVTVSEMIDYTGFDTGIFSTLP